MTFVMRRHEPFGRFIDIPHGDADVVIVGTMHGRGEARLHRVTQPQNLYHHALDGLFAQTQASHLWLIPARAADYVTISRDDYDAEARRFVANEALARMPWGVRIGRAA